MSNTIDAMDTLLIGELNRNARAPYTLIAKKLEVTAITAQRRTQRLIQEGIVNLEMVPNMTKLGYHTEAFIGLHVRLARAERIVEELKSKAAIVYMAVTSGRYDILIWAVFRSPSQLAEFMEVDLAGIDGIEWMETMINIKVNKRAWDKLFGTPTAQRDIDALERRTIDVLQDDIRLPLAALAKRLNISVPTVRHRLGRLVKEGMVAFSTVANPMKLGYQAVAHIGLQVKLSRLREIEEKLEKIPNLHYVSLSAGRYDIMLWGLFRLPQDLTRFVQKELASMEGIERSETFINMDIAKWSFRDVIKSI